jgi:hypothetical protein
MSARLRAINLQNLDEVIRIINVSSRGMSIEYNLDTVSFLALSQYWNFSYEHSLVSYVDDKPAAVMIVCTDPEAREAYAFYWGALPRFWSQRVALPLFEACCSNLHQDGYIMIYGAAAPDRPARRYRVIRSHPQHTLLEMEAASPNLLAADERFRVRQVDLGILSELELPPGEPVHWCQRHSFLRRASQFLQCLGAYDDSALKAYAVVFPQPSSTTLVDIRSPENCFAAGCELIRWLLIQNFRLPFTATAVLQHTYADQLLTAMGFCAKRQWTTLYRDLRTTCAAKAGHV